jgi:hypothetical protein
MPARAAQGFRQMGIVINTNLQIRVANRPIGVSKLIGQRKSSGVAAALVDARMQGAVIGLFRYLSVGKMLHVTKQLSQANKVALVDRHQTQKTARSRAPGCAAEAVIEGGIDHLFNSRYVTLKHWSELPLQNSAGAARLYRTRIGMSRQESCEIFAQCDLRHARASPILRCPPAMAADGAPIARAR